MVRYIRAGKKKPQELPKINEDFSVDILHNVLSVYDAKEFCHKLNHALAPYSDDFDYYVELGHPEWCEVVDWDSDGNIVFTGLSDLVRRNCVEPEYKYQKIFDMIAKSLNVASIINISQSPANKNKLYIEYISHNDDSPNPDGDNDYLGFDAKPNRATEYYSNLDSANRRAKELGLKMSYYTGLGLRGDVKYAAFNKSGYSGDTPKIVAYYLVGEHQKQMPLTEEIKQDIANKQHIKFKD